MNELQVFENADFGQVRTMMKDGEAFFVGKDVATILGYAKPLNAIATHVDDDDSLKQGLTDNLGRVQETIYINESGLYSLILSSKLPKAKQFKRWVTSEVLPSIRKNGGYIQDQEQMNDEELLAKALGVANKIIEQKELKIKCQEQKIKELQPIYDYTTMILKSPSLVTITQIAKDYGLSGAKLNKYLNQFHIQYKQSGQWLLYSDYASRGYTASETIDYFDEKGIQRVKMQTKWTQKGRLFIYQTLKKKGIIPEIEKITKDEKEEDFETEGPIC